MSDIALRVEGLGKQYRIGANRSGSHFRYKSLRDTLSGLARSPLKSLQGGRGPLTEENSFWALKDVNFEVKRGDAVGIIGRNGAGKSTLLKVLSRITKPTVGRVELFGRIGSLLEVGTGFHPELSGRENIFLNGAILGMTRAEVRGKFDEIVAFSEVERFLDTPVKQYSSGMYMRLAFAVAAHLEPEILVVDEVLAVGDAEFQRKCLGKMKDVASEGRTVLFVSHNMGAVRQLCDVGIVLNKGRVALQGAPEAAVQAYLHGAGEADDDRRRAAWRRMGGSGEFQIVECRIPQTTFDPNEPKVVNVRVQRRREVATPVHVMVELYDSAGEKVVKIDSRYLNQWVRTGQAESECTFRIAHPWLAPGEYRVDVMLSSFGIIDGVEDAARLTVADVFPYPGTGGFHEMPGIVTPAGFEVTVQ